MLCMKYIVNVKSTHFFDFSTISDSKYALSRIRKKERSGYSSS